MITENISDKKTISQIWNVILDWFFPPVCAGCGRISFLLCPACDEAFYEAMLFAEKYKKNERRYYAALQVEEGNRLLEELDFLALHQNEIAHAVRDLKYHQNFAIGKVLGDYLGERFLQHDWPVDVVMPVPLGEHRFLSRGYNQAQAIAEGFCEKTSIPIDNKSLKRMKETRSQVGLNINQREANMLNAFIADGTLIKGRRILLIDDVLTTGATLRSCAVALLEGGAASVMAMTVTSGTVTDS